MANWNLRDYCNDLSIFIQLLDDMNVPLDLDSLTRLRSQLRESSNVIIGYRLEDLVINIDQPMRGFSLPSNLYSCQLFFSNSFAQKQPIIPTEDPICRFTWNLVIKAYQNLRRDGQEFRCAWHLDREYRATASTRYIHPTYHFHFGGTRLNGVLPGGLAVLSPPRLPHPPMDVFLSFHFIMLNFFDKITHPFVPGLLNNHDYQTIIQRAQERLWEPYFKAFDSTNTNTDFTRDKIFPFFV